MHFTRLTLFSLAYDTFANTPKMREAFVKTGDPDTAEKLQGITVYV
jgi:hypothetical protein